MLDHRPFNSLGQFNFDWLAARYHFSFSDYFDPSRMNWGPLRVWNDDTIQAQSGFPTHGHRDMEIITYVRKGAISHSDSLGNQGRTEAGQVQVMSAGTGIQHSEMNLEYDPTTLFQIWIMPNARGLKPRWETRDLPTDENGRFIPLVSGQGIPDVMPIAQDASLYVAHLAPGQTVEQTIGKDRLGYLVGFNGAVEVDGLRINNRDGLAIKDLDVLKLTAQGEASVLLADLPA